MCENFLLSSLECSQLHVLVYYSQIFQQGGLAPASSLAVIVAIQCEIVLLKSLIMFAPWVIK